MPHDKKISAEEPLQPKEQVWQIVHKSRKGNDLQRAVLNHLEYTLGEDMYTANRHDVFLAVSRTVRDLLMERWMHTQQTYHRQNAKRVSYLSMEFLIGRLLEDSLLALDIRDQVEKIAQSFGFTLDEIIEEESDAGLGNGGLGRLAACFLDSLATLELPAIGYGIRYEFGLFHQKVVDGFQVEEPDHWLTRGDPWEVMRSKISFRIQFCGRTERYRDPSGRERTRWVDTQKIKAVPFDILVPGHGVNTVNTLRLWSAQAAGEFDLQFFNDGNYPKAWERIVLAENISKVLYPRDDNVQGKELRLKQEYFFASASIQDIMRRHREEYPNFDNLAEKAAIQLNDTHPAIGIAELMRLLVDEEGYNWDKAWEIVTGVFSYTNHTLMAEALEKWPVDLFSRLLPRHLEIIYDINDRFLKRVAQVYPGDVDRLRRTSIIEEDWGKNVRMANLAIVGSHMVNGVARIHSNLLKTKTFKDFFEMMPSRFTNKTNGITQRRWLMKTNPALAELLTERLGPDWISDLHLLRGLVPLAGDPGFQERWRQIKADNKKVMVRYIKENTGYEVRQDSMFDCQVKRMHEYKRQQLNLLRVVARYIELKNGKCRDAVPRTIIFAGKAAPSYFMAKLVIKLINSVAEVVNNDRSIGDLLKVVFLGNYNVSLAERIFAGADLSEQISTAGTEASGTGNMKFCMNGALTIGTMDGANIEICEEVGRENIFIFGLETEQVARVYQQGYRPGDYARPGSMVDQALSWISEGRFSRGNRDIFRPFVDEMRGRDHYLTMADFDSYRACQEEVDRDYRDQATWTRKSIINVAHCGKFSSDRTIRDYAQEIWKLKPVPIRLGQD